MHQSDTNLNPLLTNLLASRLSRSLWIIGQTVPAEKLVMDCTIQGVSMTVTMNTVIECVGAVCDANEYAEHFANFGEEIYGLLLGGDCDGDTTTESEFQEWLSTIGDTNGDATTTTSSSTSWSTSSSEQAVTPSPSIITTPKLETAEPSISTFDNVEETLAPAPTELTVYVCGVSYTDAEMNCTVNMRCLLGDECSEGESCFAVPYSYCRPLTVTTVAAETISGDATTTTTASSFYSWNTSPSEQAVTPSPSVLTEVATTESAFGEEDIVVNSVGLKNASFLISPPSSNSLILVSTPKDDGSITIKAITSVIDFSSATPPYDPSSYYNASQIVSNENDNGILQDLQKGFVALSMDVWNAIDAGIFQDTDFLMGSNLTTEVVDIGTFILPLLLSSYYWLTLMKLLIIQSLSPRSNLCTRRCPLSRIHLHNHPTQ
jgi:hypothetical protein